MGGWSGGEGILMLERSLRIGRTDLVKEGACWG